MKPGPNRLFKIVESLFNLHILCFTASVTNPEEMSMYTPFSSLSLRNAFLTSSWSSGQSRLMAIDRSTPTCIESFHRCKRLLVINSIRLSVPIATRCALYRSMLQPYIHCKDSFAPNFRFPRGSCVICQAFSTALISSKASAFYFGSLKASSIVLGTCT